MNAELLYTSAPQGLKQGSRGFCTVLSTVGMPLNLATKLESLSGYRHMYPSGTPDASKNPVGFSHLRFMVGGRQISVLSRISDYGLDYSQRTNKLAHHIVVDAPMPACGPAALLAEPGVMRDHWDGQCVNIPSPPTLPNLSSEPQICRKWEAITSDAGWGGVIADAWLSTSPRPVFIIFAEHQSNELLSLIEESIALLPLNKRWQATFGTYVTTLPPDVDCRVRCVVAGSDEARMASARGIVINLTTNAAKAPDGDAANAARNGSVIGFYQKLKFDSETDALPTQENLENPTDQNHLKDDCTKSHNEEFSYHLRSSEETHPPSLKRKAAFDFKENKKSAFPTPGSVFALSALAILLLTSIGLYTSKYFLKLSGVDVSHLDEKKPDKLNETQKEQKDAAGDEQPASIENKKRSEKAKKDIAANMLDEDTKNHLSEEHNNKRFESIKNSIRILLRNNELILEEKMAFPGDKIKAEVRQIEEDPTQLQKQEFLDLIATTNLNWLVSEDGEEWTVVNEKTDSIEIGNSIAKKKLKYRISSGSFFLDSEIISVFENADKKDFSFRLNGIVSKTKSIPFAVIGEEISCSIEVANPLKDPQGYLNQLANTARFELLLCDNDGKPLQTIEMGDKQSFLITKEMVNQSRLPVSYVRARAKTGKEITIESNEILPLIFCLQANVKIDKKFSPEVVFLKRYDSEANLNCRYSNKQLGDLFTIREIVDFDSASFRDVDVLKNLFRNIEEVQQGINKIRNDFEPLLNITKGSVEEVALFRSFIKEHKSVLEDLSPADFFSKEKDVFEKLWEVTNEIHELVEMNESNDSTRFSESDKAANMKNFIKLKHKVFPNDDKTFAEFKLALEKRQIEFIEWYRRRVVQGQFSLNAFSRNIHNLFGLIKRLRELRDVLSISHTFQVEMPVGDFSIHYVHLSSEKQKSSSDDFGRKPILKQKLPIVLFCSLVDVESMPSSLQPSDSMPIPKTESVFIKP